MTTITLPSEIERPLNEEAERRGTTPELLAIDALRQRFVVPTSETEHPRTDATLADFLDGFVGIVEGSTEALSENCGKRFADGLAEAKSRGRS